MEKVYTSQTFISTFAPIMLIGGEGIIPTPLDEVTNPELFTFDIKMKQVVRQTHKRRKINVDKEMVLTIEIVIMDKKN
jgi:hypothetical protein